MVKLMVNKSKLILVLVLAAFLVVGLASAGFFDFLNGNSYETVKIGFLPSDHDAALFVADKQGLYQQKGIKAELVQFDNGGDLMAAMASGEIDVGYVGIAPVLSSVEKGVPVKIISSVQTEGSAIVVSKESNIKAAPDLKGKSIATPGEDTIQYVLLSYYLKQNGMSVDDLNVLTMKVPSMNDALRTGEIDGGITFQPYASFILTGTNNKVLADSKAILPNHPCCVVVVSDDFLINHEDKAKDIVAIHKNATKFINNSIENNKSDEVIKLLPEDCVANSNAEHYSLGSFPFISGIDDDFKNDVDNFQNLEVDIGLLKEKIPQDKLFWQP